RERSIQRQEVAALTQRAGQIDRCALALAIGEDGDRVLGAVEGGPEQVVGAAVADDDRPASRLLHVQDAGDERADRADEMPSGLEEERRAEAACQLGQPRDVWADVRLRAAVVGDPESAARVEVPEPDSR